MPFSGEIIQRGGEISVDALADTNEQERRERVRQLEQARRELSAEREAWLVSALRQQELGEPVEPFLLQSQLDSVTKALADISAGRKVLTSYGEAKVRRNGLRIDEERRQLQAATLYAAQGNQLAAAGLQQYSSALMYLDEEKRYTNAKALRITAKEMQIIGGEANAIVAKLRQAAELIE